MDMSIEIVTIYRITDGMILISADKVDILTAPDNVVVIKGHTGESVLEEAQRSIEGFTVVRRYHQLTGPSAAVITAGGTP